MIEIEWRPVRGYETLYAVSSEGQIKRIARGKRTHVGLILQPKKVSQLYESVKLFNGYGQYELKTTHEIVADAFIGPRPEGFEVNHKDFDKRNNRASNLEYMTHRENIQHAVRGGRFPQGEQVVGSKLTADDVRAMRALRTCGWSQRKLAAAFRLSQSTTCAILNRRWWKHI
jgi:hypothetical protein